ncbi:hypothetical protein V6N12_044968 [Hibiscus sabdariffa]|uniref:SEC7 domain-containing protein n=1 Tax=Hibiscus sabdariffa TaxID=183260 RepID=A0ABR2G1D6_9ROSI
MKNIKQKLTIGADHFNQDPSKGLEFLRGMHLPPDKLDPESVASFFRYTNGLDKNLTGDFLEQKKQKLSDVKVGLKDAEAMVPGCASSKLREYKSDLNNLKSEVKRIASGNLNPSARDELLESGMADALTASANQRSRLMTTTERSNQSSDRVKDSRRTMLETEELGVSIQFFRICIHSDNLSVMPITRYLFMAYDL